MRAFLVLLLLAGCSHSTVVLNNSQPSAPVTGSVNTTGAVAAIVLITTAVAATQDSSAPTPQMAADREVAEQDCTKPVDSASNLRGNLRCR